MWANERAIHDRVNAVGRDRKRDRLAFDADIAAVAREYSVETVERGFFAPESPEGDGHADRLDDSSRGAV